MKTPVIDIHVHFGAPPDRDSGCFWSRRFSRTPAYLAMKIMTRSLLRKLDIDKIRRHLLLTITGSRLVDKAVLLAMDQVYAATGQACPELTHLYVPNLYVSRLANHEPRVLFGCSVHPYRRDWRDELECCLERGAVLCKWIPSSQMIDPGQNRCLPFYRTLADHRLPLLVHSGPEYAIPTSDPSFSPFNNPRHMRRALDMGVTVILAHSAVPYLWFWGGKDRQDFVDLLRLFDEAPRKGWKLYADVAALCTPFRGPYIDIIKRHIPEERLVLGSDYPVPVIELCYSESRGFPGRLRHWLNVRLMRNSLDRNLLLLKKMGLGTALFTKGAELFRAIRRA